MLVIDSNEKLCQSVLLAIFLMKLRNYCMSSWPWNFLVHHISVSIEDANLRLMAMRNDVKVYLLPTIYFWWSWEITAVCQIDLEPFQFISHHWRYRLVIDSENVLPATFLMKLRNYSCMSNWPWNFSICHISVTIEDTDL